MVMGVAGALGESSSVTSAAKMQHKFAVRKASPLAPLPPPPSLPPPPQSRLGFTTDVFTQAGCIKACTLLRQTTRHGSSQSARASTTLAGLRLQIATVWQAPRFFTQTPQPASDQQCSIPHIYCM